MNMRVTDTIFTNNNSFNVNCDTINTNKTSLNLFGTTPTAINLESASYNVNIAGTFNGEDLSHISELTGNIQAAIDGNRNNIANGCVRKSRGTQITTPPLTLAGGRLSAYHGALSAAISSAPLVASKSTLPHTSVTGTLGGKDVYPMIQMGNRACLRANDTDNINCYMGIASGRAPNGDYEYNYRRGISMKTSAGLDANSFTEALTVVGTANITSDMTASGLLNGNDMNFQDATSSVLTQLDSKLPLTGGTITGDISATVNQTFDNASTNTCTIHSTIVADPPYSRLSACTGVYLVHGAAGAFYFLPIYYTVSNFQTNTFSQKHISGTIDYTAQSGSAVGNWTGKNMENIDSRYLVHPRWGYHCI